LLGNLTVGSGVGNRSGSNHLICRCLQAFYISNQYRRAAMLLKHHGIMNDIRFMYLAAKCYAECKEWDQCLSLLGDGELDDDVIMDVRMHVRLDAG
jgi:Anaphase-promoting complex, cyclosome, subunit 3